MIGFYYKYKETGVKKHKTLLFCFSFYFKKIFLKLLLELISGLSILITIQSYFNIVWLSYIKIYD